MIRGKRHLPQRLIWLLALLGGVCCGGSALHVSDRAWAQAQPSPEEQKRKKNEQNKKRPNQPQQGRSERPRGTPPGKPPGKAASPSPRGRSGGTATGHPPAKSQGQPRVIPPRQTQPRGSAGTPAQKGPPQPHKRQAGPDNRFQHRPPSKTPSAPGNRVTAPAPGNAKQPLPQQKGPPPPQLKRQAGPDNRFQRQPSSKTPSAPGNRVTAPAPGNVKPMPPRQKGGVRQATPPATKQGTGRGAPNNFARPHRLEDVKRGRRVTTGPGGARVIEEPGNRVIIRQNNRVVIRQNEITQVRRFTPNAQVQKLPNGINRTVVVRPGGVRVFNEVDGNGRLLRRYRRDGSGREIVLIDNRRFYRNVAIGAGVAALGVGIALALAPPTVAIPRNRYIVDYADASDDDIYDALSAPPVDRLERAYSLEEIRYSEPLRARMRRIDLDTVNFEFGSFEVPPDQYRKLERLARGMLRIIDRNPAEVFLVEGHTDAVGSDDDNLTLSDNRAEAVADILIREFDVPAENIVTQGYGEQFLKVDTDGPEHLNRRVAVRRVTPLLGLADRR